MGRGILLVLNDSELVMFLSEIGTSRSFEWTICNLVLHQKVQNETITTYKPLISAQLITNCNEY